MSHFVLCTLFLFLARQVISQEYKLVKTYTSENFFDEFRFSTDRDPTGGFVQYLPFDTAAASGLINNASGSIHLGVDHTNVYPSTGRGRPSVRVESKATYTEGLFVLDLSHMPVGCGVWPAFWTSGLEDWPAQGEIDIIENVNDATKNNAALHAVGDCAVSDAVAQTGSWKSTNCSVAHDGNQGCGTNFSEPFSYGASFNSNGGGVYAMEWTNSTVKIWFFSSDDVPLSISSAPSYLLSSSPPDPSTFGTPSASFEGPCSSSFSEKFFNHSLIFDTTFCGVWAGGDFGSGDSRCPNIRGADSHTSCIEYVSKNPQAFADAYWSLNSLRVWQKTPAYEPVSHTNQTVNSTSPIVLVPSKPGIVVSPLTGGVLHDEGKKPFPILIDPGIGDGTFSSNPVGGGNLPNGPVLVTLPGSNLPPSNPPLNNPLGGTLPPANLGPSKPLKANPHPVGPLGYFPSSGSTLGDIPLAAGLQGDLPSAPGFLNSIPLPAKPLGGQPLPAGPLSAGPIEGFLPPNSSVHGNPLPASPFGGSIQINSSLSGSPLPTGLLRVSVQINDSLTENPLLASALASNPLPGASLPGAPLPDAPLPGSSPGAPPRPAVLPGSSQGVIPRPAALPGSSLGGAPGPAALQGSSVGGTPLPAALPGSSLGGTPLPSAPALPVAPPESASLPGSSLGGTPLPSAPALPVAPPESASLPGSSLGGTPLPPAPALPVAPPESASLPGSSLGGTPLPAVLPSGSLGGTPQPPTLPLPVAPPQSSSLPGSSLGGTPLPAVLPGSSLGGAPLPAALPGNSLGGTPLPAALPGTSLGGTPLPAALPGNSLGGTLPPAGPLGDSPLPSSTVGGSPLADSPTEGSPLLDNLSGGTGLPAAPPGGFSLLGSLLSGAPVPAASLEDSPLSSSSLSGTPLPTALASNSLGGTPLPPVLPASSLGGAPLPTVLPGNSLGGTPLPAALPASSLGGAPLPAAVSGSSLGSNPLRAGPLGDSIGPAIDTEDTGQAINTLMGFLDDSSKSHVLDVFAPGSDSSAVGDTKTDAAPTPPVSQPEPARVKRQDNGNLKGFHHGDIDGIAPSSVRPYDERPSGETPPWWSPYGTFYDGELPEISDLLYDDDTTTSDAPTGTTTGAARFGHPRPTSRPGPGKNPWHRIFDSLNPTEALRLRKYVNLIETYGGEKPDPKSRIAPYVKYIKNYQDAFEDLGEDIQGAVVDLLIKGVPLPSEGGNGGYGGYGGPHAPYNGGSGGGNGQSYGSYSSRSRYGYATSRIIDVPTSMSTVFYDAPIDPYSTRDVYLAEPTHNAAPSVTEDFLEFPHQLKARQLFVPEIFFEDLVGDDGPLPPVDDYLQTIKDLDAASSKLDNIIEENFKDVSEVSPGDNDENVVDPEIYLRNPEYKHDEVLGSEESEYDLPKLIGRQFYDEAGGTGLNPAVLFYGPPYVNPDGTSELPNALTDTSTSTIPPLVDDNAGGSSLAPLAPFTPFIPFIPPAPPTAADILNSIISPASVNNIAVPAAYAPVEEPALDTTGTLIAVTLYNQSEPGSYTNTSAPEEQGGQADYGLPGLTINATVVAPNNQSEVGFNSTVLAPDAQSQPSSNTTAIAPDEQPESGYNVTSFGGVWAPAGVPESVYNAAPVAVAPTLDWTDPYSALNSLTGWFKKRFALALQHELPRDMSEMSDQENRKRYESSESSEYGHVEDLPEEDRQRLIGRRRMRW